MRYEGTSYSLAGGVRVYLPHDDERLNAVAADADPPASASAPARSPLDKDFRPVLRHAGNGRPGTAQQGLAGRRTGYARPRQKPRALGRRALCQDHLGRNWYGTIATASSNHLARHHRCTYDGMTTRWVTRASICVRQESLL
jgi:hypothetical protein